MSVCNFYFLVSSCIDPMVHVEEVIKSPHDKEIHRWFSFTYIIVGVLLKYLTEGRKKKT